MDWKENVKLFLKDYGILLTATTTFIATIVALFKDAIYSKILQPKLVKLNSEDKFVPYINERNSDTDNTVIDGYVYEIKLKNVGRTLCKNIQMYLESIQYKSLKDAKFHYLDIVNTDIIQCNGTMQAINLSQYGRPIGFNLIKILSPENGNNNLDKNEQCSARLKIGNYLLPAEETGGDYKISFCLYSENSKTKSIEVTLNWKGGWEPNKEVFHNNCVEINVEIK